MSHKIITKARSFLVYQSGNQVKNTFGKKILIHSSNRKTQLLKAGLARSICDLHEGDKQILLRGVKEGANKWKSKPCSWLEDKYGTKHQLSTNPLIDWLHFNQITMGFGFRTYLGISHKLWDPIDFPPKYVPCFSTSHHLSYYLGNYHFLDCLQSSLPFQPLPMAASILYFFLNNNKKGDIWSCNSTASNPSRASYYCTNTSSILLWSIGSCITQLPLTLPAASGLPCLTHAMLQAR